MASNEPPLPPPVLSMNAIRMSYINLFNQILDNSININCICKTTFKNSTSKKLGDEKLIKCPRDFENHNDFMSESIEENENDIEMANSTDFATVYDLDLMNSYDDKFIHSEINDSRFKLTNRQMRKICDLSCFENLRYAYNILKECFVSANKTTECDSSELNECIQNFELKWNSFKFLSKASNSCDYYGTTIFHYAASENCYHLLKCALEKYPNGIFCLDSKGMTPLMRATQRNNIKCVEYLINDTLSDLNGSMHSTYTPLWFAASNGYQELTKLLLEFNTSPSIIEKPVGKQVANQEIEDSNIYQYDEPIRKQGTNSYLFSPLRASIVYSQFKIMNYLLEYGANIYELFGISDCEQNQSNKKTNSINQDYLNTLNFFFRQFSSKMNEQNNNFLFCLNEYVDNQNVYRRMMIELIKNICKKIISYPDVMVKINSLGKNKVNQILELTEKMEHLIPDNLSWMDYLELMSEFTNSIDMFINSEQIASDQNQVNLSSATREFLQIFSQKPNYHKNLFEFSNKLLQEFFHPHSLKDICRFRIRKLMFEHMNNKRVKYTANFLKSNHQEQILSKNLGLPEPIVKFLLHKSA